jgi:hypothetical protein
MRKKNGLPRDWPFTEQPCVGLPRPAIGPQGLLAVTVGCIKARDRRTGSPVKAILARLAAAS